MTVQELIDELMKIEDKTLVMWLPELYQDDILDGVKSYKGYPNRVYLY